MPISNSSLTKARALMRSEWEWFDSSQQESILRMLDKVRAPGRKARAILRQSERPLQERVGDALGALEDA